MKKVNLKQFLKNTPVIPTHEIVLQGEAFNGETIVVKERLTFDEASTFVRNVVESIIDMDTLTYLPEFGNFILKMMVIAHYTNIRIDDCPIDKAYAVISNTDLFDQVTAGIDSAELQGLIDGAHTKVDFLVKLQESTAALRTEELIGAVQNMIETGKSVADAISTDDLKNTFEAMNHAVADVKAPAVAEEPTPVAKATSAKKSKSKKSAPTDGQLVSFPGVDDNKKG